MLSSILLKYEIDALVYRIQAVKKFQIYNIYRMLK